MSMVVYKCKYNCAECCCMSSVMAIVAYNALAKHFKMLLRFNVTVQNVSNISN